MIKPSDLLITQSQYARIQNRKLVRKHNRIYREFYSDLYLLDYTNLLWHKELYTEYNQKQWTKLSQLFQCEFNILYNADENLKVLIMYIFERIVFVEIDKDSKWIVDSFRKILDKYIILEIEDIEGMMDSQIQETYNQLFKIEDTEVNIHCKKLEIIEVMETLKMLEYCLYCIKGNREKIIINNISFDRVNSELIKMVYFYYMADYENRSGRWFYLEHVCKYADLYEDRRIYLWGQLAEIKLLKVSEKYLKDINYNEELFENWCMQYKNMLNSARRRWVEEISEYKDVRIRIPKYIRDILKAEYYRQEIIFNHMLLEGISCGNKRIEMVSRKYMRSKEEYILIINEIHSIRDMDYYNTMQSLRKYYTEESKGND